MILCITQVPFLVPGRCELGSDVSGSFNILEAANDPSVSFSPSLEQSSEICDLVGSQAKCFDWTECCSAATTCCDKMVASKRSG